MKYKNLPDFLLIDPANEPNYRHMPPSSVDCWIYHRYHYHAEHWRGCPLRVEGWAQRWHRFISQPNGHQTSTPCRFDLQQATAFAVSKACDTLLVVSTAVPVDDAVVVRGDARLVSATAVVRHGCLRNFGARGERSSWKWP